MTPPGIGSERSAFPRDTRTDDEIIADLQIFKPITSERNIWAFWDGGITKCPPWCQRNVISWVRRHGADWTVRVLDLVEDSPVHVSKYMPSSFLPDTLLNKQMSGAYVGQHSSDHIRLPLLYLYGGVWIDVGFFLFKGLDDFFWRTLQDPESPLEMAGFTLELCPGRPVILNGLLAARKGCVAIKLWHDTYQKVWNGATSSKGTSSHPLLKHLPRYEPPTPPGMGESNLSDYMTHMLCAERLRHLEDPDIRWDGPDFFANKAVFFDGGIHVLLSSYLHDGRKQFELLSKLRDGGSPDDEEYQEAEKFTSTILSMAAAMKLPKGFDWPGVEYLARIWGQPENHDADNKPGTFAAYLRWASENFEQTKDPEPLKLKFEKEILLVGKVFEIQGKATETIELQF